MPNCQNLDPLVTPYVDGELAGAERTFVEEHLRACPPCHSRVAAEQAVRDLIHTCQPALKHDCASPALRSRCALFAALKAGGGSASDVVRPPSRLWRFGAPRRIDEGGAAVGLPSSWRARLTPFALAASLVVVVGGAFLYQFTARSATLLAAELTADHVKCFAVNRVLNTHEGSAVVESSMATGFGWQAQLPPQPERAGLELIGARPCLYAEGRVAHIMYRYHGRPVSVFMLPHTVRPESLTKVMGHQCAIWSSGDRTFVLIAREPRGDVERIASFVHASLH
jgi:anti-sigma factor RsiW